MPKSMLGFGPCLVEPGADRGPLIVQWKNGQLVGGLLAQLDPAWMKVYRDQEARREELREQPNVILIEDHKDA